MTNEIPTEHEVNEPLYATVNDTANELFCSRSQIYKLAAAGELDLYRSAATNRPLVGRVSIDKLNKKTSKNRYKPDPTRPRGNALKRQRSKQNNPGGKL